MIDCLDCWLQIVSKLPGSCCFIEVVIVEVVVAIVVVVVVATIVLM